jgi:hypothetical protein
MPTHHCEQYDLRKMIELLADRFAAIQDIYVCLALVDMLPGAHAPMSTF